MPYNSPLLVYTGMIGLSVSSKVSAFLLPFIHQLLKYLTIYYLSPLYQALLDIVFFFF